MQRIVINVVIYYSRETIRCQKIALQSLIDMKPSEWRDNAVARLSARIAEQEAVIAAQDEEALAQRRVKI